jgi:Protein of unknown function (DUF4245)
MGEQIVGRAPSRGRQLGSDMIRSLGLVALVLLAWMYFSHPRSPDAIREVEWAPVAQAAAARAPYEVLAPPVTFPWAATSARVEPQADGTLAWRAGFYTPDERYAAVLQRGQFPKQAGRAQQDWIRAETRNGVPGATVEIGGRQWTRMEGDPTPDDRRSLVLVADGTATLVTGSAQWAELETLAATLAPVTA